MMEWDNWKGEVKRDGVVLPEQAHNSVMGVLGNVKPPPHSTGGLLPLRYNPDAKSFGDYQVRTLDDGYYTTLHRFSHAVVGDAAAGLVVALLGGHRPHLFAVQNNEVNYLYTPELETPNPTRFKMQQVIDGTYNMEIMLLVSSHPFVCVCKFIDRFDRKWEGRVTMRMRNE